MTDKKMLNSRGFTLIEILIATALAAIVLSAVYGTFFLVERAKDGASDSMLRLYEAQKTMDVIRRELEAMKGGSLSLTDREYLGKKGSSIEFAAFSPKSGLPSKIRYEAGEENGVLFIRKTLSAAGQPRQEAVLLEEVEGFSIEVLSEGKWVKALYSTNGTARAVRVSLEIPFKGRTLRLRETAIPRIGGGL